MLLMRPKAAETKQHLFKLEASVFQITLTVLRCCLYIVSLQLCCFSLCGKYDRKTKQANRQK